MTDSLAQNRRSLTKSDNRFDVFNLRRSDMSESWFVRRCSWLGLVVVGCGRRHAPTPRPPKGNRTACSRDGGGGGGSDGKTLDKPGLRRRTEHAHALRTRLYAHPVNDGLSRRRCHRRHRRRCCFRGRVRALRRGYIRKPQPRIQS